MHYNDRRKLEQAAGTIRESVEIYTMYKGYSQKIHDFHTYYACRIV